MRIVYTIIGVLLLASTASAQTIVDYRGIDVQSPDPTGAAGLRFQNNFKELADRIGPSNLTATAVPTVNDDVDEGYYAGSLWYDTVGGVLYWCGDNTDGAAVWHDLSTAGGAGSISDVAYAASWDEVTTIAPSKNVIYDYLSGLASVYQAADADLTTWAGVTSSANGRSLVSAADYAAMKTLLAYGTMADQNANAVAITGGTINGTTVGATTPAAAIFTSVGIGDSVFTPNKQLHIHKEQNAGTAAWISNTSTGDDSAAYLFVGHSLTNLSYGSRFGTTADEYTVAGAFKPSMLYVTSESLLTNGISLITRCAETGATDPAIRFYTGGYNDTYYRGQWSPSGGLLIATESEPSANPAGVLVFGSKGTDPTYAANTGGIHLNANVLKLYDSTTGSKTLAQLATDTDTTYTAGDGLDLTGTTFSTDLKSGGGLEIDTGKLRLSSLEVPATATDTDDAETIDFSTNLIHKITLDNDTGPCVLSFTDPPAGSRCLLILIQDADGGETVTWPVAETIYWAGGTAFVPDDTAASRAVVTLVFDGTDYYCTGYDYATP